jgi:seryl-tRNA synthetase
VSPTMTPTSAMAKAPIATPIVTPAVTPASATAQPATAADLETTPLQRAHMKYRDELYAAGILLPLGPSGLVGRSALFERVALGITKAVEFVGRDFNATGVHFPPVIPRTLVAKADYLRSFPDLLGSIHSFTGSERDQMSAIRALEEGGDWAATNGFTTTDSVLLPASCYPLYIWREGTTVKGNGEVFTLTGLCYGHEPSPDPARLRCFRQHEHVFLGTPKGAEDFAATWGDRAVQLLRGLGLPAERVVANDPFFGRVGRLLAAQQVEQALKHEVVIPITSEEHPTACASVNQHHDHFTTPFTIALASSIEGTGTTAHTACVGFGLERITLALFRHHGFDINGWPRAVRKQLLLT